MSAIGWVSLVAVALAFVSSATFVVMYRWSTRGHWRDSEHGVHLMVFSEACTAIFAYTILATAGVIPEWLRPWFRTAIFVTMAALFTWRLRLLLRDQREPVPDPDDEDHDDYENGWPPKA